MKKLYLAWDDAFKNPHSLWVKTFELPKNISAFFMKLYLHDLIFLLMYDKIPDFYLVPIFPDEDSINLPVEKTWGLVLDTERETILDKFMNFSFGGEALIEFEYPEISFPDHNLLQVYKIGHDYIASFSPVFHTRYVAVPLNKGEKYLYKVIPGIRGIYLPDPKKKDSNIDDLNNIEELCKKLKITTLCLG